jgi:endogenous inhibitor of DNA gyrase (YacG/DUF329 family)
MRNPHLRHTQVIRLGRLLDMLYKPTELAEELHLNPDTIYRSYIPAGLPVVHDETGQLWIHGPTFAAWARQTVSLRKSKRVGLADGQAWCLRCGKPVPLIDPSVRLVRPHVELMQSACPDCGATVNRVRRSENARPS